MMRVIPADGCYLRYHTDIVRQTVFADCYLRRYRVFHCYWTEAPRPGP